MSKAAELAALIGSQSALSNRNLIINGAMQVAQRGTSHAALSGYGLDRFKASSSSDGAVTVTQSTTVPSGEGFKNSMKFDVTTADTSLSASQYYQFFQPIEGQNFAHLMFGTSDAKSFTLSFWCRSNKTGTYVTTFMNSAANRFNPNNFTISSANTWEKKTITVTGDQSGTWLTTNGIGMYVIWNLALGSDFDDGTNGTWGTGDYGSGGNVNFLDSTSNEFYITGIQLEIGEQATPFEHEPYGVTLEKAKRYYQRWDATASDATSNKPIGAGVWNGSTQVLAMFIYDEMRVSPTFTASSTGFVKAYGGGFAEVRTGGNGLDSIGTKAARFNFTVSTSRTAGHGTMIQMNANGDSLELDAEL